jgi:hypothetical protein
MSQLLLHLKSPGGARQARVPAGTLRSSEHTTSAVISTPARAAGGHADADTHARMSRTILSKPKAMRASAWVCVSAPFLHTPRATPDALHTAPRLRTPRASPLAHGTHSPRAGPGTGTDVLRKRDKRWPVWIMQISQVASCLAQVPLPPCQLLGPACQRITPRSLLLSPCSQIIPSRSVLRAAQCHARATRGSPTGARAPLWCVGLASCLARRVH